MTTEKFNFLERPNEADRSRTTVYLSHAHIYLQSAHNALYTYIILSIDSFVLNLLSAIKHIVYNTEVLMVLFV